MRFRSLTIKEIINKIKNYPEVAARDEMKKRLDTVEKTYSQLYSTELNEYIERYTTLIKSYPAVLNDTEERVTDVINGMVKEIETLLSSFLKDQKNNTGLYRLHRRHQYCQAAL